jgi:hypothetical protein
MLYAKKAAPDLIRYGLFGSINTKTKLRHNYLRIRRLPPPIYYGENQLITGFRESDISGKCIQGVFVL